MTQQQNRKTVLAFLCCTVFLASCQMRARIGVAPDSTASNLTFVLSAWNDDTPGALAEIKVSRCIEHEGDFPVRGETVWLASVRDEARRPVVGRIEYGTDLGGLETLEGPTPLTTGCYIVSAYAMFPDPRGAVSVIRVQSDGAVSVDDDA